MPLNPELIPFLTKTIEDVSKEFFPRIYNEKNVPLEVQELNHIYMEAIPYTVRIRKYFRFISYSLYIIYNHESEKPIERKTIRLPMVDDNWMFMKRTTKLCSYQELFDEIVNNHGYKHKELLTKKSYNKFAQLMMFRDNTLIEYLQNSDKFRELWVEHIQNNNPKDCKRLDKYMAGRLPYIDRYEKHWM